MVQGSQMYSGKHSCPSSCFWLPFIIHLCRASPVVAKVSRFEVYKAHVVNDHHKTHWNFNPMVPQVVFHDGSRWGSLVAFKVLAGAFHERWFVIKLIRGAPR